MSEAEYLGRQSPAPSQYEINERLTISKLLGFRIIKPKSKILWKLPKASGPDMGSYKPEISFNKSSNLKRATSAVFGKQKRIIKTKLPKEKTTPGAGTYKLDNVYSKIYKPMRTHRR